MLFAGFFHSFHVHSDSAPLSTVLDASSFLDLYAIWNSAPLHASFGGAGSIRPPTCLVGDHDFGMLIGQVAFYADRNRPVIGTVPACTGPVMV